MQALVRMGSRPNLVSLRPSILRWVATLDSTVIAATFDICASLQLSMDDSTVSLVLADAAHAAAVRMLCWTLRSFTQAHDARAGC